MKLVESVRRNAEAWTRVLLYLTAGIPLVYTNALIFPYITTKALFFMITVQLALLTALLACLLNGRRISLGPLGFLFALYMLWGLVAVLAADGTGLSFWSTFDRMEGYVLWLHLFAFFVLLVNFFEPKHWYRFIRLSFFVSVAVTLMGLAQYAGTYKLTDAERRVDVLFGNPIFFALYVLFHVGFGTLLLLRTSSQGKRYLYGIALGFEGLALLLSGTRGALLGLLAGVVVGALVFALAARSGGVRVLCAGVALTGVLAVSGLVFFNDSAFVTLNPYLERFSVISVSNIQNQSRYYIWEAALDGIAAAPLLGYGYGQFDKVFERYVDPAYYGGGLSGSPELWMDRAHNMLFDAAVQTGLPGATLLLLMLGYAAYVCFTCKAVGGLERAVLLGLLAAYTVHSMFSFNAVGGLVFIVVLLAYVHMLDRRERTYRIPTVSGVPALVGVVLIGTGAAGMFIADADRIMFAHRARVIEETEPDASVAEARAYRALADSRHIDNRHAYAEIPYIAVAAFTRAAPDPAAREELDELVLWAERNLREERLPTPKDLYYLGEYYRLSGQHGEAKRVLSEGLEQAPERLLLNITHARVHIAAGEYEEALRAARRVYELEPAYKESAIAYAVALMYAGEHERADEVLRERFDSVYVASAELIEAQLAARLYDRAVYILTESVAHDPDRVGHWRLLLRAHGLRGDEEAYARTLQDFNEHHPDL